MLWSCISFLIIVRLVWVLCSEWFCSEVFVVCTWKPCDSLSSNYIRVVDVGKNLSVLFFHGIGDIGLRFVFLIINCALIVLLKRYNWLLFVFSVIDLVFLGIFIVLVDLGLLYNSWCKLWRSRVFFLISLQWNFISFLLC